MSRFVAGRKRGRSVLRSKRTRLVVQGRAILEDRVLEDAVLVCENGKIAYVGPKRDEVPDLVVTDGYLAPGYVDIHIHGASGHDVMDGTEAALRGVSEALAKYGVTGFLATTLTADVDRLLSVLRLCKAFADEQQKAGLGEGTSGAAVRDVDGEDASAVVPDAGEKGNFGEIASQGEEEASGLHANAKGCATTGARLLGVHLEGPWINKRYRGAQNEAHVVAPTVADAEALLEAAGGLLKVVTLAPEQPGAAEVIAYLNAHGVKASVGHTDATYEDVKTGLEHGLSHVTHCFNAMRGLHHREPGVVGAAMHHEELTTELIADGVHVHPVVMSILYKIKQAARLVLVSDGMRAVGMGDGEYDLGGLRVQMKNGEARLEDGTLAGSTLTLERAVQNMVQLCKVALPDAVAMASTTPAKVIGYGDRKGRLVAGFDADFLVLDKNLHVRKTFVGGELVFEK